MEFGNKLKNLFKRSLAEQLADPVGRSKAIEAACEEARLLQEKSPGEPEVWRKPIRQLLESFHRAQLPDTEVLRAASHTLPSDEHWRKELLSRLLPEAHIPKGDLDLLEIEARSQPRNLRLWNRLFEEARYYEDDELRLHFQEQFVEVVIEFFPARGESHWFDMETEPRARSLFLNLLDETADRIIHRKECSERAWSILRAAQEHFPERSEVLLALLPMVIERDSDDSESLEILLQGLLLDPDNLPAKRHAGRLLARRPGHAKQGIEMLLQCYEQDPNHEATVAALVEYFKKEGWVEEGHVPVLESWFEKHSDDLESAQLLATNYSRRQDLSPTALKVYEFICDQPGEPDAALLKTLGEAHASNENWEGVAKVYERLRAADRISFENTVALASAYANLGRNDPAARELYEAAINEGTRNPAIHEAYAGILYREDPSRPEAQIQFRTTRQLDSSGYWGNTGMLWIEARAANHEKVIREAIPFLRQFPDRDELKDVVAKCLAANPRRALIRPLLELAPPIAHDIFERARRRNSEALLLLSNCVRYRMQGDKLDEETRELVRQLLQRDPEQEEIRVRYAHLMWDGGEKQAAMVHYMDLLHRWRRSTGTTSAGSSGAISRVALRERDSVLIRVTDHLLEQEEGLSEEQEQLLVEAALSPDASEDIILKIARKQNVRARGAHPLSMALLERAAGLVPEDNELNLSLAEMRASRGAPRRAAIEILMHLEKDPQDGRALQALAYILPKLERGQVTPELVERILDLHERRQDSLRRTTKQMLASIVAFAESPPERARALLENVASDDATPHAVRQALDQLG